MTTSPWVTWDPELGRWRDYKNADVDGGKHVRIVAATLRDVGEALDPSVRVVTMRGSMASVEAMHNRHRAQLAQKG